MSYKELFILRHAKSSWDEPSIDDVDRTLTSRGINDAHAMAARLKKQLKDVDLIITSHANRATHTAAIFAQELGCPLNKLNVTSKLYEISESNLSSVVKSLPEDLTRILLVGHNPTFTNFVNRYLKNVIDNVPTCGIVGLSFNSSTWADISRDNMQSSFFDFPKNII